MTTSTAHSGKTLVSHFFHLRDQIEAEIAASIVTFGEKTRLRDACEYALFSGGKRFRPIIVKMVAEALGHELDVSCAALSVEFFHTASLIVDDLPCMDNDEERRDKPSVHKVYGETIALLASYALICAAFERIHQGSEKLKQFGPYYAEVSDKICSLALESACRCAGILGATGGQFLDLYPPQQNLEGIKEIIQKKTITLFEVCFVFGWLFGGGELEKLSEVKKLAFHFGMAFQIADDFVDAHNDEKKQRNINIVTFLGKQRSMQLFQHEMEEFRTLLSELNLATASFEKMEQQLIKSVLAYAHKLED